MNIPEEYPLRLVLNNEVHSRPHEMLNPPERISFLAVLIEDGDRAREWEHLGELCARYGVPLEDSERDQLRIDLGEFRVKLERHEEFTRYEFVKEGRFQSPFSEPVTVFLPPGWLARIPGKTIVAGHIAVLKEAPALEEIAAHFDNATLTGSKNDRTLAFSDFLLHEDGFSRFLIVADSRSPAQTGRLALRLMEIEIYRMLALMGVPEAKKVREGLMDADARLSNLTDAIAHGSAKSDDELLAELSALAAKVESLVSGSYHRFDASRAYFAIVEQRLSGWHEVPIPGISTFSGFLGRRLSLARQSCDSVSGWLEQLSQRIGNASDLLRTRVDVRREAQNQELLAALNRRFELQLRMQISVKRMTIAVFTYYSVNLVGFVAAAIADNFHLSWNILAIKTAFIPIMILLGYFAGEKARRVI